MHLDVVYSQKSESLEIQAYIYQIKNWWLKIRLKIREECYYQFWNNAAI